MRAWTLTFSAGLLICVLVGCLSPSDGPVAGAVLHPGEGLQARNKFGSVRIEYVSPLKRKYVWDDRARIVEMNSRREPFLGEWGLYHSADCIVLLFPLCRTPRLVTLEAVHDFDSYDQLYAFLVEGGGVMDWVYTSDGLLVGFSRTPQRSQVTIYVRQLTINGEKPGGLKGARNRDIRPYGLGRPPAGT